MTLHWWMHWFWVTLLTVQLVSGRSLATPQAEELQHFAADTPDQTRPSDRQGRATYLTKAPYTTTKKPLNTTTKLAEEKKNDDWLVNSVADSDNSTVIDNSTEEIVHPSQQWTPATTTEAATTQTTASVDAPKNQTSLNITVENSNQTIQNQSATVAPSRKRNLTRYPEVKEIDNIEGAAESRIVTEKPLSLETTFLQTRIPPNVESSRRIIDQGHSGMDTGEIAGISFGALVLAALAGSTAFVLYRRRYLNKPQTLNDKCSNPDSSGYLDDSTIRDNSEEMYSLDNDSFLNSLEAMTIQNYWTDTVKHTKL